MPKRNTAGANTIEKFTGKERDTEGNLNLDYFGARYYDPALGRWHGVDPQATRLPEWTPYNYVLNNPLGFIDPDGQREFASYYHYRQYAEENDLEILDRDEIGSQGHWLSVDRQRGSDVWKAAIKYNLKQGAGYEEYATISQRAAFYDWFQSYSENLGFETKWAGAAASVASQVSYLQFFGEGAGNFAEVGNRMIFEDAFSKLRALANGEVLKGSAAFAWDAMMLSQEQSLVQPLYKVSPAFETVKTIMTQDFVVELFSPLPAFRGNMLNVSDRWAYGMETMGYKVIPANKPNAGANYNNMSIYRKLRHAGASGSY